MRKNEFIEIVFAWFFLLGIIAMAGALSGCEVIKAGVDACREGDCR